MKKLVIAIVVVLAVFAIWNTVSNKTVDTGAQNGVPVADTSPIKIGVVGPLTGDVSSLGVAAAKAVELAVNETNSSGGINGRQIQLITEDGKCNTKSASDAGAKLISVDKVTAIVGGFCSGETLAFGPNAMQNKVVMISPISSSPALSKLGKYFFRDYPSDVFQGAFAANYLFNDLKVKKVAVVFSNTDWGVGVKSVFVEKFKELGGEVVLDEGASQDSRDFRTILGKVKSSGAEYMYAPLYTESTTAFLKQIKDLGIKTKVLGGDTWADTDLQANIDGGLGAQYLEVKTNSSDTFVKNFTAAYPEIKIGAGTVQAYDAANILINALKVAGTDDADKLAEAMRATKHNGVSGYIEFDENGDMTEASYVVKKLLGKGKTEVVK